MQLCSCNSCHAFNLVLAVCTLPCFMPPIRGQRPLRCNQWSARPVLWAANLTYISAGCKMSVTLGAPFLPENTHTLSYTTWNHRKIWKASFARHGGHFGIFIGEKRLYLKIRRVFTRFRWLFRVPYACHAKSDRHFCSLQIGLTLFRQHIDFIYFKGKRKKPYYHTLNYSDRPRGHARSLASTKVWSDIIHGYQKLRCAVGYLIAT